MKSPLGKLNGNIKDLIYFFYKIREGKVYRATKIEKNSKEVKG